ncbi:putative bifunctional diguanylate cyclase/phosphodiesterase [Martelella endophytica]|uniref:putative bifunctional diguanylate cyclase/phosphodiesterase n=1 Tax=Martelella endophytica TaxID=1486262 RepID=UPI0005F19575|nr:EAL domain-containing protein [Martelella endophytica]
MNNLVTCLAVEHSHSAIAAALFVSLIGGALTISLTTRVRQAPRSQSWLWLLLAGLVGGMTAWCTHFIAMLGYDVGLPHNYDPLLTFLSLGSVIVTTTVGIFIIGNAGRSLLVEAGGAVVSLGVVLMHFIGMSGYDVPGYLVWSTPYIIACLISGMVFGMLAFSTLVRMRFRYHGLAAALLLTVSIVCVHFVSIAGLTFVPDGSIILPNSGLQTQTMVFFTIQGSGMVVVLGLSLLLLDIKNRENVRSEVRRASVHDALTGLPNRTAMGEELARLISEKGAGGIQFALAFLDVRGFKGLNDVRGHAAGDFVLSSVAARLRGSLPAGVFAARTGNDEFAILIPDLQHRGDVQRLLRRVIQEVARPASWSGQQFVVRLDAGIAVFPDDGQVSDELVARADAALLRAKRTRDVTFYDAGVDHGERRLNALALDLRRAFEDGEFQLYYQQQHLTGDRSIFGFEVLLRWFHRDYGFIPPDEFIPLAERTGFIHVLGEWVLRQAAADAVTWKNPFQVGVNVAPEQLADPNLAQIVGAVLKETGLPPERLELEITESGIVDDFHRALASIEAVKALGVKVAMDDFGTGYSSLTTLQQFPFDKIKIDRSFVAGLPHDELSAAICRSTVIISKSLGIRVLAEGVETEEQLAFLQREGCPRAQGYYFGRPKPRSEIEDLVNG